MTDKELANNAAKFRVSLGPIIEKNITAITNTSATKLDDGYVRMTTLQAWRSFVLDAQLPASSLGFYSEAQNDGLTSIVLASTGLWRPSLKSLRGVIENVLHSFYYMDHPVEYRLWEVGKYRPAFSKLFEYFDEHPDLSSIGQTLNPVAALKADYRALSEIVHASAKTARMTDDLNQTQLWKTAVADIGKWSTYHKSVLRDVNTLILILMKDHLQGAANIGLRQSISTVIGPNKDGEISAKLGVKLLRS